MKPLTAQTDRGDPRRAGRRGTSRRACVDGGVSTDTRTLAAGAVFFALRGENFDGDTFAAERARRAVPRWSSSTRWDGEAPADAAVIVVADTLLALQKLAHWWRKQLDIPVVGITGSNGKTSTKDFTAAVLSPEVQRLRHARKPEQPHRRAANRARHHAGAHAPRSGRWA